VPQIVKGFGLSKVQTGFVTAIPYAVGLIGMIVWGHRSDRQLERRMHAMIPLALAAFGFGASALLNDPVQKMVLMTIGIFGVFAVLPVFWTLPTAYLSGASAAAGIAIINSVGNLAGFAGSSAMGFLKDQTGGFVAGLMLIAALGIMALLLVRSLQHDVELERAPEGVPAE
jgi:nitrate/nitrite transporter NarK